ncbi:MAG: SpoIIE family protein phosphatase [Candidatus Nanopelagicales bacterium]
MRNEWFARATALDPMGELAREVDWAATSWGPPEDWAPGLRSAVEMCMSTRFPVLVTWGPDLLMLYNDGYRTMLGTDKQVGAMGRPVLEVWSEIGDEIAPLFDHVLSTGTPVYFDNTLLTINRSGYDEDAWFAFCYSAIRDELGVVRGVLDISHEITDQVVGRRRLDLLSTVSARMHRVSGDVDGVGRAVAETLQGSPDVEAAQLYLVDEGRPLLLAASNVRTGDLLDDDVLLSVLAERSPRREGQCLVVPLVGAAGEEPVGLMVLQAATARPFDESYAGFLELLATTIGTALSSAVRHMSELGELRDVSATLQASMLPTLTASPDAVARYLPATGGLAVGGDWYDSVAMDDCLALVVGDCVGHGLAAAAVMGQLRTASRTLLLDGHGPAETLVALDRFAAELPGAEMTTVFCACLDPDTGVLTYVRGGHPPALVIGPHGHRWLLGGHGTPLGVSGPEPRDEVEDVLAEDELVLVFTDGLVERRDEDLGDGHRRLHDAAAALIGSTSAADVDLEAFVDGVLSAMIPEGSRDDVALIVARLPRA